MEFLEKGINDSTVKAYYDFMVDAAVIFGANRTVAEHDLLDSLKFEIELAKVLCSHCLINRNFFKFLFKSFQIAVPEGERRNLSALYNPYTVRELQVLFPYINWLDYINSVLLNVLTIDENEIVIMDVPNYFVQLGPILQTTPKRTIANYFAWRSVLFASGLMNEVLRTRKLTYLATTIGLRKHYPRYNECVTLTTK